MLICNEKISYGSLAGSNITTFFPDIEDHILDFLVDPGFDRIYSRADTLVDDFLYDRVVFIIDGTKNAIDEDLSVC